MLLLENHLVIASGKMLLSLASVQQSRLGVQTRPRVSACCRGHSAACQLACHPLVQTVQGDPTGNQPELGTDHELNLNQDCNFNAHSGRLHPGVTGSGQPTAELSAIV